jgi:hypothetical protein
MVGRSTEGIRGRHSNVDSRVGLTMMSHCSPSEWSMSFGRKGDWWTFRADTLWKKDPEGDAMEEGMVVSSRGGGRGLLRVVVSRWFRWWWQQRQ